MPSFKVEPVYLSPEHARQVERFTGYPYEPEVDARLRAWVAFKQYEYGLHKAAAHEKLIAFLHDYLARRRARERESG